MLTIRIEYDIGPLSPNRTRRLHWGARAALAKDAKWAAYAAWVSAGSPRAAGPVRCAIVSYRSRALDDDNLIAACKPLLDGIFKGAMTPDDSPAYLELGSVRQERCRRGDELVEFEVEEI